MSYTVQLADSAIKTMKRMDRHQSKLILSWIERNLEGCDNPRAYGRPLTANLKGLWRYRIGVYRVIAAIHDDVVVIEVIDVGHRREIYDQ